MVKGLDKEALSILSKLIPTPVKKQPMIIVLTTIVVSFIVISVIYLMVTFYIDITLCLLYVIVIAK